MLPSSKNDEQLLDLIMDPEDLDQDEVDIVVDGWKTILLEEKREIFFEEMFKEDVSSHKSGRKKPILRVEGGGGKPASIPENELEKLIAGLDCLKKTVEDGFRKTKEKLDEHDKRIKNVELYVIEEKKRKEEDDNRQAEYNSQFLFEEDYHGGGGEETYGVGGDGKGQTEEENDGKEQEAAAAGVVVEVEKEKEMEQEAAAAAGVVVEVEKEKEMEQEAAARVVVEKQKEKEMEAPIRITRARSLSQYKRTPFTEGRRGEKGDKTKMTKKRKMRRRMTRRRDKRQQHSELKRKRLRFPFVV